MNAQQSAYQKGFDAGLHGKTIDETPYRGHTTGFHRGLANQWRRGCENGDMAACMKQNAFRKRDEATEFEEQGDNAMVREDWLAACELWTKAASKLRDAACDLKYHHNLMRTRNEQQP